MKKLGIAIAVLMLLTGAAQATETCSGPMVTKAQAKAAIFNLGLSIQILEGEGHVPELNRELGPIDRAAGRAFLKLVEFVKADGKCLSMPPDEVDAMLAATSRTAGLMVKYKLVEPMIRGMYKTYGEKVTLEILRDLRGFVSACRVFRKLPPMKELEPESI